MADGRRTQVVLLDDKRVDLIVQSKLLAGDLLDLVVSYFSLKEKEYFGLACADETGHYNWLQLDRKVLDHEFLQRTGTLTLYFQVQFFCESIAHLRDSITIELFYLQAKASIYKGDIEVDSETVFELAAYVLQATEGDFISDSKTRSDLKTLPVLPHRTLREHPSLPFCEEKIIFYYRQLGGLSRGQAIICYMQLVESLPTYGVHFYELKDKTGIPWWLGLGYKGIGQYDIQDRLTPRKVFQWRQLQNIYYRDRKFSIEVIDPRRVVHTLSNLNLYEESLEEDIYDELSDAIADPTTQVSVSKRTFGASNATLHAWYGSPVIVKSMWTMAVSQHQFYLDKKHSKERYPASRTFSQIAKDLTTSTNSLTSSHTSEMSEEQPPTTMKEGGGGSTNSMTLLKDAKEASSRELLAIEGEAARKELVEALKARKVVLQDTLQEKLDTLRQLCLKEAEITGELPVEYPRIPGEPLPRPKTRVTTAFTLSDKIINTPEHHTDDEGLSKLEGEYEIQSKITTAAMKLANDPTISKKVRKTRRDSYKKSAHRLNSIEVQLTDLRRKLGLELAEPTPERKLLDEYNSLNRPGRKAGTPHTPPSSRFGFGFMSERGRSKTLDDKKGARIRSKSVPRQLLNGGWRSPSQGRKGKGQAPLEIYSDAPPKGSPKVSKRSEKGTRNGKPPISSCQSASNLESSKDLANGPPRQMRSNSMSSKDSYHSQRSMDYVENQRQASYPKAPVAHPDAFSKSTPSLNVQPESPRTDSPRRRRNASNATSNGSSSTRGPPPAYRSSTPFRSLNRPGRYHESPELSSARRDYDPPRLGHHAASLHDLQLSSVRRDLPEFADDQEYHQQPISLSQPASPKKHLSLGNLNVKSTSMPDPQCLEEQSPADYTPYRSRTSYRSQQYQNYASRLQGPKKFEFEEVNSYINQPYDPGTDQPDQRQDPGDYQDRVEFSLGPPPPLERGSAHSGDFQPGASRHRHPSLSSQQSSSSHSSHSSSLAVQLGHNSSSSSGGSSPYHSQQQHPSQRPPLYTHVSEYTSSYATISHTPSNMNVASHNMSAHSQSMTLYQEPQPADSYRTEPKPAAVYRTTSSMVLRPQQTFGSGIAVSKVHYQPVTPMTCEPVARLKKQTHSSSTNSLPSFTALEGRPPTARLHEERVPSYPKVSRDSFSASLDDLTYRGDAGESLADSFSEEMLTWLEEHEGNPQSGTLV